MTLIVTINSRESIWLLADRRLSYNGHRRKDDARKVMFLETKDGVAILGYAGLGATELGTEPSDWMSSVLRGGKLPLEQSLGVLAEAMKKQLPRHMARMSGTGAPAHSVIVTAIVEDEVRLYSINLALSLDRKHYRYRYKRHIRYVNNGAAIRAPRIGLGGSGAPYLLNDKFWVRPLLRLISAYDHGQASSRIVTDYLANLNFKVHQGVKDRTVGPRCIVAWRNKKNGNHKEGGGHYYYSGNIKDTNSPCLPTIMIGNDVRAIASVLMPLFSKKFEKIKIGEPVMEIDKDELNAELARLPGNPDEKFR